MLNLMKKLMVKKTKKDKGLLASEMTLAQLKDLAVSIKLFSKEEVSKMKKGPLLKAIRAWEEVEVAKHRKGGMKVLKAQPPVVESPVEDIYNGIKVLSRTERVINGKTYEDIKVVGGVVFTVLKS